MKCSCGRSGQSWTLLSAASSVMQRTEVTVVVVLRYCSQVSSPEYTVLYSLIPVWWQLVVVTLWQSEQAGRLVLVHNTSQIVRSKKQRSCDNPLTLPEVGPVLPVRHLHILRAFHLLLLLLLLSLPHSKLWTSFLQDLGCCYRSV